MFSYIWVRNFYQLLCNEILLRLISLNNIMRISPRSQRECDMGPYKVTFQNHNFNEHCSYLYSIDLRTCWHFYWLAESSCYWEPWTLPIGHYIALPAFSVLVLNCRGSLSHRLSTMPENANAAWSLLPFPFVVWNQNNNRGWSKSAKNEI